ncbi:uncharacterized protein C8R40DRAFT_386565 [Lentinula edodes]|uniref:uncharacterized protein n=1 Tax=Lentinula edodes TaxID=5353 RepID=UPI001E8CE7C0|nr:uncharacterized protein C8R40DRAFT_386565 [Lentinula edodes]KAH7873405.1 hypothetical protein C8R40DRAFT_386565 [Lentinula edodes]
MHGFNVECGRVYCAYFLFGKSPIFGSFFQVLKFWALTIRTYYSVRRVKTIFYLYVQVFTCTCVQRPFSLRTPELSKYLFTAISDCL